eukprot:TRINITY_DN1827_c0_g1_i6.p1 TRINITY_DN1827_c0_g1~~TRINITY_DN1827_c0_g1_i6.p1  ORF type:complete len:105 (-),score=49.10 TRINITY_DN1827_c0_g1_i6:7-321(-)
MIRRPPRSTQSRSSAASDVYKRQGINAEYGAGIAQLVEHDPVSYTHLRAHETVLDLVCRLLLEKKKKTISFKAFYINISLNNFEMQFYMYKMYKYICTQIVLHE